MAYEVMSMQKYSDLRKLAFKVAIQVLGLFTRIPECIVERWGLSMLILLYWAGGKYFL